MHYYKTPTKKQEIVNRADLENRLNTIERIVFKIESDAGTAISERETELLQLYKTDINILIKQIGVL